MYLLNCVAFLYFEFLSEHWWFLYLALNEVSHNPIYVCFVFGLLVVISAW